MGGDLNAFQTQLRLPASADHDGQTGHRADDDGVDKGTGHGNQALTGEILGLSGGSGNRRRTQTGLVGEDTAGDTLLHSDQHRTDRTAGHSAGIECTGNNLHHGGGDLGHIANQQDQSKQNVQHGHERHHNLCHLGDTLQPADDDQTHADGQHDAGAHQQHVGLNTENGKGLAGLIRIKEVGNSGGNAVDLGKGTDTQQTGAGAEDGKQHSQPLPLGAHAALNVVERAAQCVTILIQLTEADGQIPFGKLGRHTEESRN